jgi:hypothetical protein
MEFHPDASEEIPKDLPPEKWPKVRMTVYVDADHVDDLVTRISITGILVMIKASEDGGDINLWLRIGGFQGFLWN